ncbi:MAG: hypothetical protein IPL41_15690 [Micropruina sp.]|nr:hypothetical protein [Micropruina sp.]
MSRFSHDAYSVADINAGGICESGSELVVILQELERFSQDLGCRFGLSGLAPQRFILGPQSSQLGTHLTHIRAARHPLLRLLQLAVIPRPHPRIDGVPIQSVLPQ